MMPSLRFCKAFLAFVICHMWLLSLVSSQSSTTSDSSSPGTSPSPSGMASASVPMTTDSASSMSAMSSASAAPSAASTASSSGMASTSMLPTNAASTSMGGMGVSSLWSTSSPDNSSSSSSPGSYNSTISCRTFYCDGTNCYWMFMNTTAAPCPYGCDYCEFRQMNESMYSVGCADSCDASRCVNATQMDCVKDCCNTTHCLNATLLAMEPTTSPTVPMTTKKATMTTTTTTTAPTTRASNGMKCKSLTCTGADCYTTATPVMTWCYGDTETYCKLMKMTEGSTATWMAGCSVDCTEQTACGSSTPACHQECCMASAAGDCLKLDGKLNMPNSGGGSSTQALPSTLMGLLGPCLMLWMMVFMGELL